MKSTFYSIHIGTSDPNLAAKLAKAVENFYADPHIVMSGQVTVVDDDPNAAKHIDEEYVKVSEMQALATKEM